MQISGVIERVSGYVRAAASGQRLVALKRGLVLPGLCQSNCFRELRFGICALTRKLPAICADDSCVDAFRRGQPQAFVSSEARANEGAGAERKMHRATPHD